MKIIIKEIKDSEQFKSWDEIASKVNRFITPSEDYYELYYEYDRYDDWLDPLPKETKHAFVYNGVSMIEGLDYLYHNVIWDLSKLNPQLYKELDEYDEDDPILDEKIKIYVLEHFDELAEKYYKDISEEYIEEAYDYFNEEIEELKNLYSYEFTN